MQALASRRQQLLLHTLPDLAASTLQQINNHIK
jgi:hypothetical protein